MALNRKTMRFVTNLLQQMEPWMIRRQIEDRIAIGKNDIFFAGFPFGTLCDADQRCHVKPLLGEYLGGDRDLPFAAVDHEQIRRWKFAGDNPGTTPRQRFAHRGVVVTGLQRRHIEATVFGALHRQAIEDDTRRDRRFAHRVRHVKALDSLRRRRQAERVLQRGQSLFLRSFLRQPLANRERCVLRCHRQPDAPFAAWIDDDLDFVSRL